MTDDQRGVLDYLQNIYGVDTDKEVFVRSYISQIGGDLSGAELDYRLFKNGDQKYLPPYVQASYNHHIQYCMR